ncbi:DUF6505 family protein [Loktanella sp. S4079]|uniref:DUF6505 family protein n=1 Tax=Loktanella sp. S4079 TaxID=579483 RepID=UPI0005F9E41F|nr:DUF6505 family protein [Loktanella sp. S4079]KJZ20458.1 hypothetical protein TW80_06600 [Loktanella sp. S4079]
MNNLLLARAIHFDESDQMIFHTPARTGEWCVSGGFEFSNWTEADLTGKAKQAFSNGWLGLETFGRVTVVAVSVIEQHELAVLEHALAAHFVSHYGAPSVEAATPVAREQLIQMADLCAGQEQNTLLMVSRTLNETGVLEQYRVTPPQSAGLDQLAVHSVPDETDQI